MICIIIFEHDVMMVAYSTVVLYVLTLSPVLCQSLNSDQTCTGPKVYLDEESGNCTVCPTTCPPGYGYFEHPCGYGEMRRNRCSPCVNGESYSSGDDKSRCYPCNLCLKHEIITSCTATSNTQCGAACVDGYGWDSLRKICKDCEHADRDRLPGCEKPPKVMVTKHSVHKVVCNTDAGWQWQSPPQQYSWFRNNEILDTSDGNKFVEKGNLLLIFDQDIEDDGVYTCRAEWNANKEHNFDVMKMSSNNVEIFNKEQNGDSTSDPTTKETDFITKEQHGEGSEYTIKRSKLLITKEKDKEDSGKNGTAALIRRGGHKEFKCWPVIMGLICLCVICIFIPTGWLLDKIRWHCNRITNCNASRSTTENTIVLFREPSPIHTHPLPSISTTTVPLLGPDSQKVCHDDLLTEKSEKQHSHVEELNSSIQIEDISNGGAIALQDADEMITRQPDKSVESLFKKALECSAGFYYDDLDVATTDRLEVLLNPHPDPKPPIKYWKHLANRVGIKDQATLNSIGSYKNFHGYLLTKYVPMQTFLEALQTVENHQATKVVCKTVIKMHENKNEMV